MSDVERHRREVRQLLGIRAARGRDLAQDYLARVETARGPEVRKRLEDDATEQWEFGNRGTTWIVRPVD
jgi:hypothetical protein